MATEYSGGIGPFPFTSDPVNGTDEVQTLTIGGTPTGGTFQLKFEGILTSAITWSSTNNTLLSNIQTALDAHPSLGTNGCVASDSTLSSGIGNLLLTFGSARGRQAVETMTYVSALTGSSPTLAIAETTPGVDASARGAAIGATIINSTTGDTFTNIGTALAPTWAPEGGSKEVSLSSANLLAMNATPVTLIAAPGANRVTIVEDILFKMTRTATAYANGGALEFRYTDGSGQKVTADLASTVLTTAGAATTYTKVLGIEASMVPVVNAAIVITNATAAFITGTGTAKAYIKYRVENVA